MAKDFESYQALSLLMRERDSERDNTFEKYDEYFHVDWTLPEELNDIDWMRCVPTTYIYDATETGERVLSSARVKPTKAPLLPDEENRREANRQENNLMWQLRNASRRRSRNVVSDIAESALRYAASACLVIDLDWQIEQVKAIGGDTRRLELARRDGRFVVEVYNPKAVHVRRSSYGLEAVLLTVERKAAEVIDEWGDLAEELQSLADNDETILYCDLFTWEARVVWCETISEVVSGGVKTKTDPDTATANYVIIPPTDHKLEFIPWAAVMGGSSLEVDEEKRYRPMAYALHRGDVINTLNIVRSIRVSEVIKNAGAPRYAETGQATGAGETVVDHTDPTAPMKVAPGKDIKQLAVPQGDPYMAEVDAQQRQDIERGTLASVLQGAGVPSGTAFATLNLATQTAVGQLKPPKEITEQVVATIFTIMLYWVKLTGKDLVAYGMDARSNLGEKYTITADSIELDGIYIEVELTPDLPTDRAQRAAVAGGMVQWGYPREFALEDVGVTDPIQAMDRWYSERQIEFEFTLAQQQRTAEMQMQLQQMQEQLAQAIQALQAQQSQQQGAQAKAQMDSLRNISGEVYNTAEGGIPPAMVQGGLERESVTGRDRMGNEITGAEPGGNGRG